MRGKRSSSINILFQCVTVPIDPLKRFLCVFVSLCICAFWETQVFVPLHKNTKFVFLCTQNVFGRLYPPLLVADYVVPAEEDLLSSFPLHRPVIIING